MFDSLKKFAMEHILRHYRDPSSWAGGVVMVLAYFNVPPNANLDGLVEGILANLVGILLIAMDGRINPNSTAAGSLALHPDRVRDPDQTSTSLETTRYSPTDSP